MLENELYNSMALVTLLKFWLKPRVKWATSEQCFKSYVILYIVKYNPKSRSRERGKR